MRFSRLFGSGLNSKSYDPRDKIWAEFHCNLCGEDTEIDVTRLMNTFDFKRERSCPHCGLVDASDREANIKAMLDKLVSDKSRIEIEIEKLINELEQIVEIDK